MKTFTSVLLLILALTVSAKQQTYDTGEITTKQWRENNEVVYFNDNYAVGWQLSLIEWDGEFYSTGNSEKGVQLGSSKHPIKSFCIKSNDISNDQATNITKITVTTCGAKDIKGEVSVTVDGAEFGQPLELTNEPTELVFEGCSTSPDNVVITWNQTSEVAFYLRQIVVEYDTHYTQLLLPKISPYPQNPDRGMEMHIGDIVTISCLTEDATIHYRIDDGEWQESLDTVEIPIVQNTDVYAYTSLGDEKTDIWSAHYYIILDSPTFSLEPGYADKGDEVEILAQEGASIFYTLTGERPGFAADRLKYDGYPIQLDSTTYIRAFCDMPKMEYSESSSALYIVNPDRLLIWEFNGVETPSTDGVDTYLTLSPNCITEGRWRAVCEKSCAVTADSLPRLGKKNDLFETGSLFLEDSPIPEEGIIHAIAMQVSLGGTYALLQYYVDGKAVNSLTFPSTINYGENIGVFPIRDVENGNLEIRSMRTDGYEAISKIMILYRTPETPTTICDTKEQKGGVEYRDLMGRIIKNPNQPGIYIFTKDGKSSKIRL